MNIDNIEEKIEKIELDILKCDETIAKAEEKKNKLISKKENLINESMLEIVKDVAVTPKELKMIIDAIKNNKLDVIKNNIKRDEV